MFSMTGRTTGHLHDCYHTGPTARIVASDGGLTKSTADILQAACTYTNWFELPCVIYTT